MKNCFAILLFLLPVFLHAQSYQRKVLDAGIKDSVFTFTTAMNSGTVVQHYTYLGETVTAAGDTIRVMTALEEKTSVDGKRQSGLNPQLLLFDGQNRRTGSYGLNNAADLPERMENGELVFSNRNKPGCDQKSITRIGLNDGIPPMIYILCDDYGGSSFMFGKM